MQINYIRFILFTFFLGIAQLIINSSTSFYVDFLGIILVIIIITNNYQLRFLIILAFIADLIGHWYLGTHLLSITLLGFISKYLLNFYRICNGFQKTVISGFLCSVLFLIIALIGLITHNDDFTWVSFIIEIAIFNPIILWLFHTFVLQIAPDIIRI